MRTRDWLQLEGTDCRDPFQGCVAVFSDYSMQESLPWEKLTANSDLNLAVYLSVMTALREMGSLSLPTADKEVKQWQKGKSHKHILITKGALPKHANCIPRSSLGNTSS